MRQVMALRGVPSSLAERLVETALQNGPTPVERRSDGLWWLVSPSGRNLSEAEFLSLIVDQAVDGRSVRIGWALLESGKESVGGTANLVVGRVGPSPPKLGSKEVVVLSRRQAGLRAALLWVEKGQSAPTRVWDLKRAVGTMFPERTAGQTATLASLLGESWFDDAPPALRARQLAVLWSRVLEIAIEMGVRNVEALWEWFGQEPEPVNFGRFAFGPEKIAALPARPGVYLMRDSSGEIAYVGKAKNLAARVPAYFRSPTTVSEHDGRIAKEIVDFEIVELGSELEALLVEQRLIGFYRPRLNIQTEVHERQHWERVRGNYALVLSSSRPGHVEVFLVTRAGRVLQVRTQPGLPNRLELEAAVSALFFEKAQEVGVSVEGEIVFSWMARVQPWEHVVLVERCANAEECVQQIDGLTREALGKSSFLASGT